MDLFKVFFVILIAFTCQILAMPPINIVESSKTLDSEERNAFDEIEIELSQENEEPELEFSDPKIMDLEAMEKEIAHDEEVKVNYSQSESPVITRYISKLISGSVEKYLSRKKNTWRCRGLNPGPFTCKANALPLRYIPSLIDWERILKNSKCCFFQFLHAAF